MGMGSKRVIVVEGFGMLVLCRSFMYAWFSYLVLWFLFLN